jgi:hypothetical protein
MITLTIVKMGDYCSFILFEAYAEAEIHFSLARNI